MGIKKSSAKTAVALPVGIGLGVLVSLIVTLIGATAITQLVTTEKISENNIGYAIIAVLLISSIIGAWMAATQTKRLRLQVCLLEGTGYFLTLMAMTALFFGGRYQGMWATCITILLGSTMMALLSTLGQRKWKIKNKAYR
jgi:putative membrane protein (TIGR04086 family)